MTETTALTVSTPSYSATELQDNPRLGTELKLYEIITSLIAPIPTSPQSVATQIDGLRPRNYSESAGELDLVEVSEFQEGVWPVFIKVAEQVPWNHTSGQEHLADALSALKALDGRPELTSPEQRIWRELPSITTALENAVQDTQTLAADHTTVAGANLEAFIARLCGRGLVDTPRVALHSLREALENASWPANTPDSDHAAQRQPGREETVQLICAAQWAIHAGDCIYKHCASKTLSWGTPARMYGRAGRKWSGKPGFSTARWAFWRSAFVEIGALTDAHIPEPVRAAAAEAAAAMLKVESTGSDNQSTLYSLLR